MSDFDFDAMKDGILAQLEGEQSEGAKMGGLDLEALKAAMSHPEAAKTVAELFPYEAAAPNPGDPAPDFRLPWLHGHGQQGESLRLSDHFGKRPVGLIFGSYT